MTLPGDGQGRREPDLWTVSVLAGTLNEKEHAELGMRQNSGVLMRRLVVIIQYTIVKPCCPA